MADIHFNDNTLQVINALNDKINIALEECIAELESQAKRNTRVATGQTKNSWKHKVDNDQHKAIVGSDSENAIWEEYGTGEYALNGNGRRGGWYYVDENGNGHYTHGKKPSRALHNAYVSLKNKLIERMQKAVKEVGP